MVTYLVDVMGGRQKLGRSEVTGDDLGTSPDEGVVNDVVLGAPGWDPEEPVEPEAIVVLLL